MVFHSKGANTLGLGAVAGRADRQEVGTVRLNWTLKSLLNKQNCVHESTNAGQMSRYILGGICYNLCQVFCSSFEKK